MFSWFKNKEVNIPKALPNEQHQAVLVNGKILRVFRPTKNFEGYDAQGNLLANYLKDRRYYLREGNVVLQELTKTWRQERKIIWEDEL